MRVVSAQIDRRFAILVLLVSLGFSLARDRITLNAADHSVADVSMRDLAPLQLDSDLLPNLIRVHPRVFSGGNPDGAAAFEELSKRGFRTLISVDGAKPDVEAARLAGLRYVHLPHGYDGIEVERALELAKAVRELDGPIYIHCHHGKHRSPAAASVACVVAGMLPASRGRSVLEIAGTDPRYRGLYQSVARSKQAPASQLDAVEVQYREVVPVPPMTVAMLAIAKSHDKLTRYAERGHLDIPNQSDSAQHDVQEEAILLHDHFKELLRMPRRQMDSARFLEILHESAESAAGLSEGLQEQTRQATPSDAPTRLLERITKNCRACHESFRD